MGFHSLNPLSVPAPALAHVVSGESGVIFTFGLPQVRGYVPLASFKTFLLIFDFLVLEYDMPNIVVWVFFWGGVVYSE